MDPQSLSNVITMITRKIYDDCAFYGFISSFPSRAFVETVELPKHEILFKDTPIIISDKRSFFDTYDPLHLIFINDSFTTSTLINQNSLVRPFFNSTINRTIFYDGYQIYFQFIVYFEDFSAFIPSNVFSTSPTSSSTTGMYTSYSYNTYWTYNTNWFLYSTWSSWYYDDPIPLPKEENPYRIFFILATVAVIAAIIVIINTVIRRFLSKRLMNNEISMDDDESYEFPQSISTQTSPILVRSKVMVGSTNSPIYANQAQTNMIFPQPVVFYPTTTSANNPNQQ